MKITNKVKIFRNKKQLTQKELALKAQISERQLQRIEEGEQDPKMSTVVKLAVALEVSLTDLFPLLSEKSN